MQVVSGAQSYLGKYLKYLTKLREEATSVSRILLGVSVATIYACAHVRIPMEIQKKNIYIIYIY